MKEKFKKLGEQVDKNKGKIMFVAGVAVGAVGFGVLRKYQYKIRIMGAEKIQIEGAKGTYMLFNHKDGSQTLANEIWAIYSDKQTIQPEVITDALRNAFGLID